MLKSAALSLKINKLNSGIRGLEMITSVDVGKNHRYNPAQTLRLLEVTAHSCSFVATCRGDVK